MSNIGKGIPATAAFVEAHQRKHGFAKPLADDPNYQRALAEAQQRNNNAIVMPQVPRMNGTEARYSLILEAMKRRGDIVDYAYEPLKLRWLDMSYKADFVVQLCQSPTIAQMVSLCRSSGAELIHNAALRDTMEEIKMSVMPRFRMVEIKGSQVWDRDIVRFRGARGIWSGFFEFEMHQWKGGEWARIH